MIDTRLSLYRFDLLNFALHYTGGSLINNLTHAYTTHAQINCISPLGILLELYLEFAFKCSKY